MAAAFVIADTNVFLHHPDRLDTLDLAAELGLDARPVHLVIPMTVLDELDTAKDRGQGEARTNARATIKLLDGYLKDPGLISEIRPASDPANAAPRGAFTVEILADPPGHIPLARTDDEIIDRAVALQDLAGRPVTAVTGDVGMSTRARLAGLTARRLDWPEPPPKQPKGQRSYPTSCQRVKTPWRAPGGADRDGEGSVAGCGMGYGAFTAGPDRGVGSIRPATVVSSCCTWDPRAAREHP